MELQTLQYLTPKRWLNALKIYASYYLSLATRKPVVWGFPVFFFLEPTNRCNFKCPECASGTGTLTRPLGFIEEGVFKKVIDEIAPHSLYLQLYLQGEPYIHKQLPALIDYARSKKLFTVLSTNGSFINKKNVEKVVLSAPDKLIFSLDGLDEQSYQEYRIGGTFKQADEALRLLVETKRKLKTNRPFIELQFLVMKQNEHQTAMVIPYGKSVGVDKITLKTMQVNSIEGAEKFLPVDNSFSRYHFDGKSLQMKSPLKNECIALWQTSVVTWDGTVVPCCFDKDAEFPLGSINTASFKDIWKSPAYNHFRKGLLHNRKGLAMCSNCTMGLKRSILETELS